MTDQSNTRVTEEELSAYVDGQLDRTRAGEIDAWLQTQPEEAARVAAYTHQNRMLHELYDPVIEEAVPISWLQPRRISSVWQKGRLAAMLAGACVLGGAIGWTLRGSKELSPSSLAMLARQAATAHIVYTPDNRHPVEVSAAEEAHLIAWLSKRIGASLAVPSLASEGFQLVGGRLVTSEGGAAGGGPGALFMYEDGAGQRLTLYVRRDLPGNRDTAFRFAQERGVNTFYWIDNQLGYALSGEIDKNRLLRIARLLFKQFNP